MKVSELIELLAVLPLDAEVKLGITFVRDTAEDEGFAYAPVVKVGHDVDGISGEGIVIIAGAEDADVADEVDLSCSIDVAR